LELGVYNSAGERVKVLFDGNISGSPVGSQLSSNGLLSSWDAPLNLIMPPGVTTRDGDTTFTWDGSNQQGQAVSNGSYWLKFDVFEPNSHVTTWVLGAQVVRPARANALGVYNSAGERVAKLDLPVGADAGSFQLLESSGSNARIQVSTTSGPQVLLWDGTGGQGIPADGGTYLIRAETDGVSRLEAFTLIKAPLGNGSVLGAPNPLDSGTSAWTLYFEARPAATARAWLYDVAGELVRSAAGPASGTLQLDGSGLAGGPYLLVLDVDGAAPYRQKAKLAVTR